MVHHQAMQRGRTPEQHCILQASKSPVRHLRDRHVRLCSTLVLKFRLTKSPVYSTLPNSASASTPASSPTKRSKRSSTSARRSASKRNSKKRSSTPPASSPRRRVSSLEAPAWSLAPRASLQWQSQPRESPSPHSHRATWPSTDSAVNRLISRYETTPPRQRNKSRHSHRARRSRMHRRYTSRPHRRKQRNERDGCPVLLYCCD